MPELWIELPTNPDEVREIEVDDQALWAAFFAEHKLAVAPGEPLVGKLKARVQGDGALVEGSLVGSVVLPCDRCAADVSHALDVTFEAFEEVDATELGPGENLVRKEKGVLLLDAAGLLWQQFLLDLPVKTLCDKACKGLCPGCGVNLNEGVCECGPDEGDPRLAVLRNLKLRQ